MSFNLWWQSPSAVILEPKKIKSVTVSIVSPSIWHEVMGLDAMVFVFWILSFNPAFSLSSFTFIKSLFSFSLSAIGWCHLHIWGYWYFSQVSWFRLVLHPAQHLAWCTLNIFGRNDAKAETPVLWPPHVKSWLIWKDPDAGKDWGQKEKGTTEVEIVGWHHQFNGHEFE